MYVPEPINIEIDGERKKPMGLSICFIRFGQSSGCFVGRGKDMAVFAVSTVCTTTIAICVYFVNEWS